MYIPEHIEELLAEVKNDYGGLWDFDPTIDSSRIKELSYGRLILAIFDWDQKMLEWLTFFSARRALACWELSCENTRPQQMVQQIWRYLMRGQEIDFSEATRATESPFKDCRYSDTQSASDSVAECARYIQTGDPLQAAYCVSSADVAYDHVLTDHNFREWLTHFAIPIAFEKREMTRDELNAFRPKNS